MVRRHILQPSRCIYSSDVASSAASDRVSVYLTHVPGATVAGEVSGGECAEVREDPVRLIPSRLRSLLARQELDLRHQVGPTLRWPVWPPVTLSRNDSHTSLKRDKYHQSCVTN